MSDVGGQKSEAGGRKADCLIFAGIMQLHRGTGHLPTFKNSVITIGTFDGVHQGHRKIIDSVVDEAKKINGTSILITFDPHPRKVVNPDQPLSLINTIDEKTELLARTGLDHVVIAPFTKEFSELPANDYVEDFLVKNFQPHTIIIGYDHHFGKDRAGNWKLLEEKADVFHYQLKEIPKQALDEVAISSTKIRKALLSGDVEQANRLLGYDFFFEGRVIHGDKVGRKLGYPTANLQLTGADKIRPCDGVYAAYVQLKEKTYKAMMSVGNRPTLPGSDYRVEVNLFDFDGDLYGQTLRVSVKKYLRPQEKYESLEALKQQIEKDKENSLAVL